MSVLRIQSKSNYLDDPAMDAVNYSSPKYPTTKPNKGNQMAMTRKEEKKIEHGKFYWAKFQQQAFMLPQWEPVEAYRKEGKIYFKMTGTTNRLRCGAIIKIDTKPLTKETK